MRLLRFAAAAALLFFSADARAQGRALEDPSKASDKARTDVSLVPVAGGNTDLGFGVGETGDVARHAPGFAPYRWRIENGGFITFRAQDGSVGIPYVDTYFLLTIPDLIPNVLRLEVRPSFTRETTLKYYGIGNASQIGPEADPSAEYYEYGRIHPKLAVRARMRVAPHVFVQVGAQYAHNWIDLRSTSKLAEDMARAAPEVRQMLGSAESHGVAFFEYAAIYDQRDNETSAHRGQYHQVKLRMSPGGTSYLPYRYAQMNATLRAYTTPIHRYLTLAARVVADVQVGDPPFYELARFEDAYAIGGWQGVRGVPAQRYYGKVKLFTNLEARSELVDFRLFDKTFTFGTALFFDGGRVFADLHSHPELDGTGVGLKYGVGGGLRLQQSDTFVVRFDVAYSPDARPVGLYFGAGQMF